MIEQKTKIQLAMLVAVVFWAGAFIAGKIGLQEFSPYGLTFFRFFFATIVIFALLVYREGANWRLERSVWPVAILLGIIGMFGYHVLFFTALKYTSAVNSSMIGATNPLITTILAALFLGEFLNWKRVVAILVAFSGVVLTVTNGDLNILLHFDFNRGDIIMLAAVFCWAVYSVISKRAMGRTTPLKLTAHVFLVCVVMMIPFMIGEKIWLQLPGIGFQGWASVIYMAIFPSVLGYLIQMTSIQQIGASRTAIFINLVPMVSMVLAYFILHEPIGWFKVMTAGMIISGVYLSTRLGQKRQVNPS
jgi:drug/metabolite transporter (DMT)-like permease